MAGRLTDQIVFITGASRGIGRNIALELAKEGAHIIVAARSVEENPRMPGTIYSVAKEIKSLGTGARALPVRCNLVDEESIQSAVGTARAEFGHIDVLINNAGVRPLTKLLELPLRHWDLVWSVNARGAFLCTKLIVPQMIERRHGTVINVSSGAARQGMADRAIYCITKRADELMAEVLELEEGGQGVRFFSLQPERMVVTEGARLTGVARPGVETEPPETMGQAALWLIAESPAELSGKHFYSQSILRDVANNRLPDPIAT